MIGYLEGRVLQRAVDSVVLLTSGGVGYQVFVPLPLLAEGVVLDAPLRLFTVTVVRDNDLSLYGFASPVGKTLFEMLLKAAGVGPKLALSLLSAFSPDELRRAIVQQDVLLLATIPGVGKKTANRLCVELGDRLGQADTSLPGAEDGVRNGAGDLISALTNLGFPEKDVIPVVRQLNGEDLPFQALLKKALGMLGRN